MSSKIITQAQIAREVGVSQAAVSAILSGAALSGAGTLNVSDETRVAVLAAAEKLGYTGRRVAVCRRGTDGRSVLIVESVPAQSSVRVELLTEAYQTLMGKILAASSRYLQSCGIGLSVFHLGESRELTERLSRSDVGGVFWRAGNFDSALLHWVASRFPLVFLNREWRAAVLFDSVCVDQEENLLVAAEYLWAQGHRRIATFGHYRNNFGFRRRMAAYARFVEDRELRNYMEFQEILDDPLISPVEKASSIVKVWKLLGKEAPTALITGDVFALPLLREARMAGIAIPDDLSVVGIDNITSCSLVDPQLTSVDQPFDEMCRVAVDLLLRRKADLKAVSQAVRIMPQLVVRESVRNLHVKPVARRVGVSRRNTAMNLTPA